MTYRETDDVIIQYKNLYNVCWSKRTKTKISSINSFVYAHRSRVVITKRRTRSIITYNVGIICTAAAAAATASTLRWIQIIHHNRCVCTCVYTYTYVSSIRLYETSFCQTIYRLLCMNRHTRRHTDAIHHMYK
jgi:hypothetical protein